MGSSSVVSPPHASLLRVYHLTSAMHGINSIAMARLKVSRFSDLNDPFEAMGPMWRRIELRSKVRELRDRWDSKLGLLCFSSDWTNPVLWSHYADRHKGICLGFDVPREHAKSVVYEAKRLDIRTAEFEQLQDAPEPPDEILLTKFKHWDYEAERRVFLNLSECTKEGSLFFWPFGSTLRLAEVILGDLCPLDLTAVKSMAACRALGPVVFRARLAGKSFNVVPDGDTVGTANAV